MCDQDLTQEKVNQETAKILWSELQRFFAQGLAIFVADELDLVVVSDAFAKDDKAQVQTWMQQQKVYAVKDAQAMAWLKEDVMVWAVVIKPWILVQAVSEV